MNLNLKAAKQLTFDAIVIGSGLSGGIAAKELTEKGLKVLLIERGPDHKHIESYTHALTEPWELPHGGRLTNEIKDKFPNMTIEGSYPINETNDQFWLPYEDSPYIQKQGFNWFRGYGTGGKSLLWGRQVYRWSDLDFEANAKEGIAIDWPIRYNEIKPWYEKVEKFIGVSGEYLGLNHLPDSVFQPAMEMNCLEKDFKAKIESKYDRHITIGRVAHITNPTQEQTDLGRSSCQYRNACIKGCPYGAYFSTNSASLPAAEKTGNLTFITNAIVSEIVYDKETKKAKSIKVIDSETKEEVELFSKLFFLNASTIGSAHVLLNSQSDAFPGGLGNNNDVLGRNLMDHHSRAGASGVYKGLEEKYYFGNRANGIFIPRYRNIGNDKRDYLRAFDYQGGGYRGKGDGNSKDSFGANFKKSASNLGSWFMSLSAFGECLPYHENRMYLSDNEKDPFGIPKIVFDASFKENEYKMRVDMEQDAGEMLEASGFTNIRTFAHPSPNIGLSKHEMGTARMGKDPATSVLNKNNQVWDCKNVFVTDGACMTSSSMVNPSLTYMALAARAADFAVNELNRKNL